MAVAGTLAKFFVSFDLMKAGVPAITAPQPEEAMTALQKRAEALEVQALEG